MDELSIEQIKRQDFVDNKIMELINNLIPNNEEEVKCITVWDAEAIYPIRDAIEDALVNYYKVCDEQSFYPYLIDEP